MFEIYFLYFLHPLKKGIANYWISDWPLALETIHNLDFPENVH